MNQIKIYKIFSTPEAAHMVPSKSISPQSNRYSYLYHQRLVLPPFEY